MVKSPILYVWWSPKHATDTSYKLGLRLYQAIIHTNYLSSKTICILWYKHWNVLTTILAEDQLRS